MEEAVPSFQMLLRLMQRSTDKLMTCMDSICKASRRNKARYANLLSTILQEDFREQHTATEWLVGALSGASSVLLTCVFTLCANSPKEHYWPVALQLIKIATCYLDPGDRVTHELPLVPQNDVARVRFKLAQQCRSSLALLPGLLRDTLDFLAGNAASGAAVIAAGCSCAKHVHTAQQQQVCSTEDMHRLQYGISVLKLFHAVNSMWPGQAGLLATPEGQAAAGPAFVLAAVLLEQAAGLDSRSQVQSADTVAVEAANAAIKAYALLAKQLYNRLQNSRQLLEEEEDSPEQQLLKSPAVLHLLLLLIDMQLEQLDGNGGIRQSCSNHGTSTKEVRVTAAQQYHKQLLQSFGGLSDRLWLELTSAQAAAAAKHFDPLSLLDLSLAALQSLTTRCVESENNLPDDARDVVLCTLLAQLISALTPTAQQHWQAGSFEQAVAALAVAQEASTGLAHFSFMCSRPADAATGAVASDSATADDQALMLQAYRQQQLVPDMLQGLIDCMELISQPASATLAKENSSAGAGAQEPDSISHNRCTSSSSTDGATGGSFAPDRLWARLFDLLLSTGARVYAGVYVFLPSVIGVAECHSSLVTPQMQVTAARIVEGGLRTAVQHVAADEQLALVADGLAEVLDSGLCAIGVPSLQGCQDPCWIDGSGANCLVSYVTSASAALSVGSCDLFDSAAHHGLFALLVSSLKLAAAAGASSGVVYKVEGIAGALINQAVKACMQAARDALVSAPATPWLLIMARCMLVEARMLQQSKVLLVTAAQSSDAEPAAAASPDGHATGYNSALASTHMDTEVLQQAITRICSCFRLVEAVCVSAHAVPATAADVLQRELIVLWLDQQLILQLKQAADIVLYAVYLRTGTSTRIRQVMQQAFSTIPAAAAVVGELAAADTAAARNLIISSSFIAQLPQALETAAQQLCALLPLPLCCNNPSCSNMSGQSELQLVGGKSCVCARCEVARYCGLECQAAHWQAHKRVCKMIKKSRLAPMAGLSSSSAAAAAADKQPRSSSPPQP